MKKLSGGGRFLLATTLLGAGITAGAALPDPSRTAVIAAALVLWLVGFTSKNAPGRRESSC